MLALTVYCAILFTRDILCCVYIHVLIHCYIVECNKLCAYVFIGSPRSVIFRRTKYLNLRQLIELNLPGLIGEFVVMQARTWGGRGGGAGWFEGVWTNPTFLATWHSTTNNPGVTYMHMLLYVYKTKCCFPNNAHWMCSRLHSHALVYIVLVAGSISLSINLEL